MENNLRAIDFISDFKSIKLNGIYVFVVNNCNVCDKYIEKIKEKNYFSDYNIINCMEDIVFFMETLGLDDMPYTILFKNNTRIYECGGVLFNKQVNTLKGLL